ncbi:MAG: transcriptional repressor [Acidobacteriota bacterium]|nr:transcriptional repressor [Acidobacteriota bacterium]MDQ7087391.1 transcriptional repressor [Acidobacteriota bacterium]
METFQALCRARGIPLTIQRRRTYMAILPRTDHPTADQVHATVNQELPGISRMTVYRILELLVDMGLVRKICSPDAAARYDPNTRVHHHLVCLRCHKLIDIACPRLNTIEAPPDAAELGFEVSDYFVQFRGVCRDCRDAPRVADRRRRGRAGAGSPTKQGDMS